LSWVHKDKKVFGASISLASAPDCWGVHFNRNDTLRLEFIHEKPAAVATRVSWGERSRRNHLAVTRILAEEQIH
jgi:hypothetical protein